MINYRKKPPHPLHFAAFAAGFLLLGGCNSGFVKNYPPEGIGFRQARFEEVSSMREYRACRDEAMRLDKFARESEEGQAKYLASSRLLDRCESELGPQNSGVAKEERLRAYAVSIINYLKGGDLKKARANLDHFRSTFKGEDLYLSDGASFIDSMELLLKPINGNEPATDSELNPSFALKNEMKRVRHWSLN
jgi:hypothetical protein